VSEHWATDVIGKKWQAYATGPQCFDCWGLVCHGFQNMHGIDLDRHLEIPTLNPVAFHKVVMTEIKTGNWQQLDHAEDGCLILMSTARIWHHVGMWLNINGGRLLHSREGLGVTLDSKRTLNSFHRVEYWKYVPVIHTAPSI